MVICTNPNCGYQWTPRTKNPKSCPRCKLYINYGTNTGERNGQWKGSAVSYGALHDYIKYHKKKSDKCEGCGENKKLDLANISGEYKRELSDWEWLCRKCHMGKDGRAARLRFTGHKHSPEWRKMISELHKGKPKTEAQRKKMSEARKNYLKAASKQPQSPLQTSA